MEIEKIRELLALMQETGTHRLFFKENGFEIELERRGAAQTLQDEALLQTESNPMKREMEEHILSSSPSISEPQTKTADEEPGHSIASPMVGTFYLTPSPEEPPFVKVGDPVEEGTTVCIIEAMKVMNEVKANCSGHVAKVLVENGHPVEFGTKLFLIR